MFVNTKEICKKNSRVMAFNVWDLDTPYFLIKEAEKSKVNLIIQVSEKVAKKYDIVFHNVLKKMAEESKIKVAVSLDHARDRSFIRECIDRGWKSIMFDGSNLEFFDNINKTSEIVKYAHNFGCSIEGELGEIRGSEDGIISDKEDKLEFDEVKEFYNKTKVDLLAVSIGTSHGFYTNEKININYPLIEQIISKLEAPFVIHGGSGLPDEIMFRLNKIGYSKFNVSTEVKEAIYLYYEELIVEKVKDPMKRFSKFENTINKLFLQNFRRINL